MKINSKNLILFIILLAIIIGLFGIYYWQKGQVVVDDSLITDGQSLEVKDKGPEEERPTVKIKIDKTVHANNLIYEEAKQTKNADKCANMTGDEQKDLCVKLIAVDLRDVDLCRKIKNRNINKDCEDMAVYFQAINNNNISSCLLIKDEYLKDSCANRIMSQNDYTKEKCQSLEDSQKELCLNNILYEEAVSSNDPALCPEAGKGECLSEILETTQESSGH